MKDGMIRREILAGLLVAPVLGGTPVLARSLQDAAQPGDTHLLDFRKDRYLLNGANAGPLSAIPGLAQRHAGGLALSPDGRLAMFAPGKARMDVQAGLLLEPSSENRTSNHNAAPLTTAGWVVNGAPPAGATWRVVDRRDALYEAVDPESGEPIFRALIDAGIMNGMVLQGANPDARKAFLVTADGAISTPTPHSISAWMRCIAGSGDIRISGAANGPKVDHTDWRRTSRANITATSPGQALTVVIDPLSTIEIILWQLEPGEMCTSPIVVAGAATVRAGDTFSVTNPEAMKVPFTLQLEATMGRGDAIDRSWFAVSGPGNAITVARTRDNALTLSGSGENHDGTLSPRVPRILGPGAARAALQVKAQGRILSIGGANAHDPFSLAPDGLDTVTVGARPDGTSPLNGWIRTLEISGPRTPEALMAATASPPAAMVQDIFRHVDPAGDDAADGLTPATAWKTLARVTSVALPAGVHILLKRGGSWSETLIPPAHWCTIGAYAEGARPIVGVGQDYGFDENSKDGVRLEGLHLRDWKIRGWNNFGFNSHMLEDCEVGPILPGQPETNRLGVASRRFRNFYIGHCHVHDVIGDDVFLQETSDGWIISEGNRYGPAKGAAADNFQVSQNVAAHVRLSGDIYDMRGSDSGKGNVVLGGGASATIEDFRAYGLNFSLGIDCDNTVVRRGHISGSRQNAYSWGVGAGGPDDVRNHLYEDLVIEDCNRAVSCSGTGGGPDTGPARIDFIARRLTIRNNGTGLFVDRPTSGDLSGVTYEGNDADKVINTRTVPSGGSYATLTV